MCSKSKKMVFLARMIKHELCMIYAFFEFFFPRNFSKFLPENVFDFVVQKIIFDQNFFLKDAINLATRGPLYTCLVQLKVFSFWGVTRRRGGSRQMVTKCDMQGGGSKVTIF